MKYVHSTGAVIRALCLNSRCPLFFVQSKLFFACHSLNPVLPLLLCSLSLFTYTKKKRKESHPLNTTTPSLSQWLPFSSPLWFLVSSWPPPSPLLPSPAKKSSVLPASIPRNLPVKVKSSTTTPQPASLPQLVRHDQRRQHRERPGSPARPDDRRRLRQTVIIRYGPITKTGKVVDKCMGCDSSLIDLSTRLFSGSAELLEGRLFGVEWFMEA